MDQNEQMINEASMYSEKIEAKNKIITDSDIFEIIEMLHNELVEVQKVYSQEKALNEGKMLADQNWTTKYLNTTFKCNFDFYDATDITVDNYDEIVNIYNNRLHEIKNMSVRIWMSYSISNGRADLVHISKRILINIYENKIDFEIGLGSQDRRLYNVYDLIKQKIQNAPDRYDYIVKKKSTIKNKIEFAIGIIPAMFICFLLILVPLIRGLYASSYVLFPVAVLLFGFFIGNLIYDGKLESLYSTISPNRKFAGRDANYKSIYKDDINEYINKSEVIIGKNIDNIKKRKEIKLLEEKYSKYIPMELIILLVLSIIVVVIGKLL